MKGAYLSLIHIYLLSLKPCIEVVNESGAMKVGKKYRGKLDKVLSLSLIHI